MSTTTYTIRSGDTLTSVATALSASRHLPVTAAFLEKANPGIHENDLQIGQVIKTVGRYTIAQGDTFTTLAQKFGLTVKDLEAANPGVDPNNMKVGSVLQIPGGTSAV